jgi:hypothetical protein
VGGNHRPRPQARCARWRRCRVAGLTCWSVRLRFADLGPQPSFRVAEATKLLENIFRSVNIALVNELKVVYSAMVRLVDPVRRVARLDGFGHLNSIWAMATLENQLKALNPEEKRALADWLWRSAEGAPDLTPAQSKVLQSRADAALHDPSKRFPLGDAEKRLRR